MLLLFIWMRITEFSYTVSNNTYFLKPFFFSFERPPENFLKLPTIHAKFFQPFASHFGYQQRKQKFQKSCQSLTNTPIQTRTFHVKTLLIRRLLIPDFEHTQEWSKQVFQNDKLREKATARKRQNINHGPLWARKLSQTFEYKRQKYENYDEGDDDKKAFEQLQWL